MRELKEDYLINRAKIKEVKPWFWKECWICENRFRKEKMYRWKYYRYNLYLFRCYMCTDCAPTLEDAEAIVLDRALDHEPEDEE